MTSRSLWSPKQRLLSCVTVTGVGNTSRRCVDTEYGSIDHVAEKGRQELNMADQSRC